MQVNLPQNLVDAFTGEGAKQLPRIAAFHEANGNLEAAGAVQIAHQATNSL
jgi:hypothetical protein